MDIFSERGWKPMKRKPLFWLARGLAFLFMLGVLMFSLDVFDTATPWYMNLIGYLIHNIPVFIVLTILGIGWYRPAWGAELFYLLMLMISIFFSQTGNVSAWWLFSIPTFIIGTLFLLEALIYWPKSTL